MNALNVFFWWSGIVSAVVQAIGLILLYVVGDYQAAARAGLWFLFAVTGCLIFPRGNK